LVHFGSSQKNKKILYIHKLLQGEIRAWNKHSVIGGSQISLSDLQGFENWLDLYLNAQFDQNA